MNPTYYRYLLMAAVGLLLLSAAPAHAGGIVFNYGNTITKLGDISPEYQDAYPSYQVGYKSGYFGIFWADLWTFQGTYCIYCQDEFKPIDAAQAAKLMGKSEVSPPFLYRFPLGLLIVGGLIVGTTLWSLIANAAAKKSYGAVPYATYQKALQIVKTHLAKPSTSPAKNAMAAREAGMRYLLSQGVPRADAEPKIAQMLDKLAATTRT